MSPVDFTLERDVKAECTALWKAIGGHVYDTSSHKMSPIRPAGFPDLVILLPRGLGMATQEVKRPKGKSSDGQIQYAAWANDAEAFHVVGGVEQLRAVLELRGLLV